jgi:WD40 repeat protein/TPR repeat protein
MDEKIPGNKYFDQAGVLQIFSNTFSRESHILTQYPGQLWQQLFNRLRWEATTQPTSFVDGLKQAYRCRIDTPVKPWFENHTVLRESQELRAVLAGHRSMIVSCGYSLKGDAIFSADFDGEIRFWDAQSGRQMHTIEAKGMLRRCALSPEGKTLAVAQGFHLQLLDSQTGEVRFAFRNHNHDVQDCVFSGDGNWVEAAMGSRVNIYNVQDGALVAELPPTGGQDRPYRWSRCAFSPDGRMVAAVAQQDKVFAIWELSSSKEVFKEYRNYASALAFSPDGRYLGSADHDQAGLRDVKNQMKIVKLEPYQCQSDFCSFSPNGHYFITAKGKKIRLWDVGLKTLAYELMGHTGDVTCAAVSPDGRRLISGSRDQTLRIWDLSKIEESDFTLPDEKENYWGYSEHVKAIKSCAISNKSKIAATTDGSITQIWDLETAAPKFSPLRHEAFSCAFSGDGASLITKGKGVVVWDAQHGTKQLAINSGSGKVVDESLSPDGLRLAVQHTSEKGNIQVWGLLDGKLQFSGTLQKDKPKPKLQGRAQSLLGVDVDKYRNIDAGSDLSQRQVTENPRCIFSSDGRWLASNYAKIIRVWEAKSGNQIAAFKGHAKAINALVFSKDGRFVLSASDDGTARLWDTKAGAQVHQLSGHKGKVYGCCFSPKEDQIVTFGEDGTLRFWDKNTGREVSVLTGHLGGVLGCAFYLDEQNLVSAGVDKTIRLWDVPSARNTLTYFSQGAVTAFTCSSEMNRILAGDESGLAYFLELHNPATAAIGPAIQRRDLFSQQPPPPESESQPKSFETEALEAHSLLPEPEHVSQELADTVRQARSGDLKAMVKMADCYLSGKGVPNDHTKAFTLFKIAAEKGDCDAQKGLGLCYKEGIGVQKDAVQSAAWYLKAAEGGSIPAQIFMASFYLKGSGVQKDLQKATEWFKMAAEKGSVVAMYELGRSYAMGRGVPKKPAEAVRWTEKAAKKGFKPAQQLLQQLSASKPEPQTEDASIGQKAQLLRAQGDLKGALALYKEQEQRLRAQGNLVALKGNMLIQKQLLQEILSDLDDQLRKKLGR